VNLKNLTGQRLQKQELPIVRLP